LKENSVISCKIWKEAGKPRCGLISDKYRQDTLLYKKRIKEGQACEMTSFTNDLHDALLPVRKSGRDFWKVWKCKFDCKTNEKLMQVDGTSDAAVIIGNFAKHFQKICTPLSPARNNEFETLSMINHFCM